MAYYSIFASRRIYSALYTFRLRLGKIVRLFIVVRRDGAPAASRFLRIPHP